MKSNTELKMIHEVCREYRVSATSDPNMCMRSVKATEEEIVWVKKRRELFQIPYDPTEPVWLHLAPMPIERQ